MTKGEVTPSFLAAGHASLGDRRTAPWLDTTDCRLALLLGRVVPAGLRADEAGVDAQSTSGPARTFRSLPRPAARSATRTSGAAVKPAIVGPSRRQVAAGQSLPSPALAVEGARVAAKDALNLLVTLAVVHRASLRAWHRGPRAERAIGVHTRARALTTGVGPALVAPRALPRLRTTGPLLLLPWMAA